MPYEYVKGRQLNRELSLTNIHSFFGRFTVIISTYHSLEKIRALPSFFTLQLYLHMLSIHACISALFSNSFATPE